MPMMRHMLNESGSRPVVFTLSADTPDFDPFVAAGSPAGVVTVTITINSGVVLYSTSFSSAGFNQSSAFAAGSTCTLINNGTIVGKGGNAGNGANGPTYPNPGTNGGGGGGGSDAMSILNDWTIDNTFGSVWGGGGGGGGGKSKLSFTFGLGGGGGGGGAGQNSGVKGNGGAGGSGGAPGGSDGTNGTLSGRGGGGTGGSNGGDSAGDGGDGGGFGVKGQNTTGATGGQPGNAITLNGKTVTWLGGNNASQVKGAVS